jgi:hypothetical protein
LPSLERINKVSERVDCKWVHQVHAGRPALLKWYEGEPVAGKLLSSLTLPDPSIVQQYMFNNV